MLAGAAQPELSGPGLAARPVALTVVLLIATLLLAFVAAACGGGEDDRDAVREAAATGRPPSASEVRLVVSRDFGGGVLRDLVVPAGKGTDALRVLAENAEVDTGYGGQFVSGIDGLQSSFGGGDAANAADWFYWVDGVMGDVGAADWKLRGGETVWWDYHRWADAMMVPLALHAFPRPYTGGQLAVTSSDEVGGLAAWAEANGLEPAERRPLAAKPPDGGLVLATAAEAAATPWLLELLDASHSGVEMIDASDGTLRLRAPGDSTQTRADAAAQGVTNQEDPDRPFLIVLGATTADLEAFLPRLTAADLSAAVGLALVDGALVRLPWLGE